MFVHNTLSQFLINDRLMKQGNFLFKTNWTLGVQHGSRGQRSLKYFMAYRKPLNKVPIEWFKSLVVERFCKPSSTSVSTLWLFEDTKHPPFCCRGACCSLLFACIWFHTDTPFDTQLLWRVIRSDIFFPLVQGTGTQN